MAILLADSGATKCEWCLIKNGKQQMVYTQGISPYFLDVGEIADLLKKELLPALKNPSVQEIYYYGTGLSNPNNVQIVRKAIKQVFPAARVYADHDMMAGARALCGNSKGVACILGTTRSALSIRSTQLWLRPSC